MRLYFVRYRFCVQLAHGCSKLAQVRWHAWNWRNVSLKILSFTRSPVVINWNPYQWLHRGRVVVTYFFVKAKLILFFIDRFAVNFMTSVADLYFKEIGNDIATPPDTLIELFTEWISENPDLCSETQPPLDLPSGAIPMALISPIEGLIRWCTLSPLFLPLNDLIYSKLHLAVLQSLTQVKMQFEN